jgi:hypothetical protein
MTYRPADYGVAQRAPEGSESVRPFGVTWLSAAMGVSRPDGQRPGELTGPVDGLEST